MLTSVVSFFFIIFFYFFFYFFLFFFIFFIFFIFFLLAVSRGKQYKESGTTVAAAYVRPRTAAAAASATASASASAAGSAGGSTAQRDLYVANVGDARAVVAVAVPPPPTAAGGGRGKSSGGGGGGARAPVLTAQRLTVDHTPNNPEESLRVQQAGGVVLRGRVNGQLAVSRYLLPVCC